MAAKGKVIDLACGSGRTLSVFPPSYTPFGIEISTRLAGAADIIFRQRGGYVISAPCIEGRRGFSDGFFAATSLRGYHEHEADPLPVLKNLQRVLAPGGIAVIKVPNYASLNRQIMGRRWCGFRYPDHLNYFTPRSLSAMAGEAGFDAGYRITGRIPTSDNIWAVLTKRTGRVQIKLGRTPP
jgi:SAM-dependent methyltransferase